MQKQLRTDTATNTIALWEQVENREEWPTIQNNRGTKIYIAPRRYVIQLQRQPGKEHITKYQIKDAKNSTPGTQLSVRTGTSTPTGFHFPTPGSREWAKHIRGLNQYKQSEDKKRFIERFIRDTRRELSTSQNMDRNWERKRKRNELSDDNNRGSDTGNYTSPSKYSRPDCRFQCNMENKEKIYNNGTRSGGERRKSTITSQGRTSPFEFSDSEIERYILEEESNYTKNIECEKENTSTNDGRGKKSIERGRDTSSSDSIRRGGKQFGYSKEEKKYK